MAKRRKRVGKSRRSHTKVHPASMLAKAGGKKKSRRKRA